MPEPIFAVIFDFDGTLADTIPAICFAFNTALEPVLGRTYSRAEVLARFGPTDEQMLAIELRDHPATLPGVIENYFAAYQAAQKDVRAFEGIAELLETLRREFPLAIMTGKSRRAAQISLAHLGWSDEFGAIVSGDDVAAPKPAPDGPLLAAREIGVAPQRCAYVGDSPADWGAASAAGMRGIVAAWHSDFRAELLALQPSRWAESPAAVLPLCR